MPTNIDAIVQIINQTKQSIINCDKGSEWNSAQFQKFCKDNNMLKLDTTINSLIVNKFVTWFVVWWTTISQCTTEQNILLHTKYIVEDLVDNYNTSYHSVSRHSADYKWGPTTIKYSTTPKDGLEYNKMRVNPTEAHIITHLLHNSCITESFERCKNAKDVNI